MNSKYSFWYIIFLGLFFTVSNAFAHRPQHSSHYRFIENKGQWNSNVLFKVDLGHGALFLEKDAFTYSILDPEYFGSLHGGGKEVAANEEREPVSGHAYKVKFQGANPEVNVQGESLLPEYFNYFKGSEKSKWASKVKAFTKVYYKDLYQGIDLKVYTHDGHLKYDFIVHPGADPSDIQLLYEGLDKISLKEGDLILGTSVGEVTESRPIAFEIQKDAPRSKVVCNYAINKSNGVSFNFPKGFSSENILVIDPELIFSTYSGSLANNFGYTATYDSDGFLYSGSTVFDFGYPVTTGAYDSTFAGYNTDMAITKYDTSGTFMVYSTYVGGWLDELPHSMIANSDDELFVFGTTGSPDFPTTSGCFDSTFNNRTDNYYYSTYREFFGLGVVYHFGSDIVVFRLNAGGDDLKASTYLGGSLNDGINSATYSNDTASRDSLRYNYADEVRGEIDIDKNNNIYLATCTNSQDFPIVGNTFQPEFGGGRLDGVVVKMDNSLSSVTWSSYLGGEKNDAVYSLDLNNSGNLYLTGGTTSESFPVTDSVMSETLSGGRADGFISYIDSQGERLIRSTYWGSEEYDQVYFIETDYRDYVYVFGQTEAKGNTFVHNVEYAVPNSGQFISKLSPLLDTLQWSTTFGTGSGSPDISPTAFLVDVCRKIYLSGWGGLANQKPYLGNNAGSTTGLPVTDDAFQMTTDGSDFYLMVMEDDASSLHYATFMGGNISSEHVDGGTSRFDKKGKVYQSVCAGCGGFASGQSDFPIKPSDAVSPTNNHSCNNAVFKFDFKLPAVIADFEVPEIGCAPYTAVFENKSLEQNATTYFWDFGDGTTSNEKSPSHTYTRAGKYEIKLKIEDRETCNLEDSISKEIVILSDTSYSLPPENICPGQSAQIGFLPNSTDDVTYTWIPSSNLSNPNVPNPVAKPGNTTLYTLLISNGVCTDTINQTVGVHPVTVNAIDDTVICSSDSPFTLTSNTTGGVSNYHWSNYQNFSDRINSDKSQASITIPVLAKENFYYLKVENDYGCSAIDSVKLRVSNYYITTSPDTLICQGDQINLKVESQFEGDTLSYSWKPESKIVGRTDSVEAIAAPLSDSYIYVSTTNQFGCKHTDSVFVNISDLTKEVLGAYADKDTVYRGGSTGLHALPVSDYYKYVWYPQKLVDDPFIRDPVATPPNTTTFAVSVQEPNLGCRLDTTVTVYVIDTYCDDSHIYIPNAFSPNGDGVNDVLYVRGKVIEELNFVIYNRWGEKVFESNNINDGWDGVYKGMKADPGVFAYYLEARCYGGEEFFRKGNITLLK